MLLLKNIEKNSHSIKAEYVPEDSKETGFVSVDISTGKIIESKTTSFDEPLGGYLYHATKALCKLIAANDTPKEQKVLWY